MFHSLLMEEHKNHFIIKEAYYGERDNRQYYQYVDGNPYSLRFHTSEYQETKYYQVYLDNKLESILDIMFSVEQYYYRELEQCEEFDKYFKLYKESIENIYRQLLSTYQENILIEESIKKSINLLVEKPLDQIVYETSYGGDELNCEMIRIEQLLTKENTLDSILLDVYEYEFNKISQPINLIPIIEKKFIKLKKQSIRIFKDNHIILIRQNSKRMKELSTLFSKKIYEYLNIHLYLKSRQTNPPHYNENNLVKLYSCLNIEYVKIIVSSLDYKLLWIFKKLHTLPNQYIAIHLIDKRILQIISLYKMIDRTVELKYNCDMSDETQLSTHLIDKLHDKLAISLLF